MALLLIGLDTPTEGRVLSRRCGCATGACASALVTGRAQGLRPFATTPSWLNGPRPEHSAACRTHSGALHNLPPVRLPAPPFLSGWWGMSLAWGVLEPVVAATARNARTALELTNVTDVALVGSVVGIVAMVLAIRVVRGIDQRQQCFSVNPPDLPAPSAAARHHGTQTPRSVPPSARPIVRARPHQTE